MEVQLSKRPAAPIVLVKSLERGHAVLPSDALSPDSPERYTRLCTSQTTYGIEATAVLLSSTVRSAEYLELDLRAIGDEPSHCLVRTG